MMSRRTGRGSLLATGPIPTRLIGNGLIGAGLIGRVLIGMGLIGIFAVPAAAQTNATPPKPALAHVHDKGVIVLRPDASPTAAPSAAPTPAAGPAAPAALPPAAPAAEVVAPHAVAITPVGSVIKECPRPFAEPDLSLAAATDGFDKALAGKLRSRHPVVVDLAQPYKLGAAPPPVLVPWFSEIKASGGTVEISQYCQGARGAFGNWLAKLFGPKPSTAYKVAQGYDAKLHVNAVDQVVTQVEFVRRGKGAAAQ